ncbi:MAG: HAD family phosphatase [Flavobacteriaceae bacterium]|nr:HAD family phosphatase [Flavobacteriaceae bacterium]
MIKSIIFDFGDVFLDLDKSGAMQNALDIFGIEALTDEMIAVNCLYEQGLISTSEFIDFYCDYFSHISSQDLIDIWNYVLKEFPKHRLEFIKQLYKQNKYKLILLSNTNELHIDWVIKNVSFYEEFKYNFSKFYLSHEIGLRKPDSDIFEFVLNENKIKAEECFFIDDTKENTDAAKLLGIHTWNIDETKEDVVDLFKIKKHLF